MEVTVSGSVAPGFEGVRSVFAENFASRGDVGAAVCVYRGGRPVVDLWAGVADVDTGRAWSDDTVVGVFSVTKGLMAIAAHMLVERGLLDVDAPVARYWPEFATNGKGSIPVRWLLGHRAGLVHVDAELRLDDVLAWDPVVEALAAQTPQWEPGSAHGYHMRTYGWLVGEVIRRVSGAASPGRFFSEEIAGPLGLSTWIGMPAELQHRCARLIPPSTDAAAVMVPDALAAKVFTGPSGLFRYDEMWNRPDVRAAEIPSSNGISDARSLARVYAACIGEVDGTRLLSADTVRRACEVQSRGPDRIIFIDSCFALGFTLGPMLPPACGPAAFGHGGAGGSMSFADPDAGIGFGYVMNKMRLDLDDRRAADLVAAVYDALR